MIFFYLSMLDTEEEKRKMADIYTEHRHRYLRVAMSILKNQTLAEDAVHNTFIELINNKEKYLNMLCSDLLPYTVSIVKSKCYDVLRKEGKYVGFDEDYNSKSDNGVEETIMERFDNEWAIGAIESLDEISQDLLRKKYVLKYSYVQIAKECDMTVKNVEVSLYRIRQKLRKMYRQEVESNV